MKNCQTTPSALFSNYPDVLSVQQVRELLGIGRAGVYKLLESRQIPCFKIGNTYKIPKSALITFVQNTTKGGNAQ